MFRNLYTCEINFRIINRIGIFLLIGLIVSSCGKTKKTFTIDGKINGMPGQLLVLEKRSINDASIIDTITTDKNGSFILSGDYGEPSLYNIVINNHSLPIIVDNSVINITADKNHLDNYVVSNSSASKKLLDFNKEYLKLNEDQIAMKLVMDSLNENNGPDSLKLELQRKGDAQEKKITDYVKQYADDVNSMPLVYYITSLYLDPYDDADYFKKLASDIPSKFNNQKLAVEFSDLIKRKQAQEAALPTGPKIGDSVIDFKLKNENGKDITLSSFKGKYILLDFWASWCPPCRGQNIYLVSAKNEFKDKNFTIVSVSLDEDKAEWLKAIKDDRLNWTNVSDLNKWKSEVIRQYGVRSIPTNYLIDPNGKIIAKDLAGDDIIEYLRNTIQ